MNTVRRRKLQPLLEIDPRFPVLPVVSLVTAATLASVSKHGNLLG
jgi:hypothetical protein